MTSMMSMERKTISLIYDKGDHQNFLLLGLGEEKHLLGAVVATGECLTKWRILGDPWRKEYNSSDEAFIELIKLSAGFIAGAL